MWWLFAMYPIERRRQICKKDSAIEVETGHISHPLIFITRPAVRIVASLF